MPPSQCNYPSDFQRIEWFCKQIKTTRLDHIHPEPPTTTTACNNKIGMIRTLRQVLHQITPGTIRELVLANHYAHRMLAHPLGSVPAGFGGMDVPVGTLKYAFENAVCLGDRPNREHLNFCFFVGHRPPGPFVEIRMKHYTKEVKPIFGFYYA